MKKYFLTFKVSFSRLLTYRMNFFLGRLRNIVILFLLYYVWTELTERSQTFAGFSQETLLTYVFGIHLLRPLIFGRQLRTIASEINDGIFSKYLTMPVSYFWYNYFRELGDRVMLFLFASFEFFVFIHLLKVDLFIQTNPTILFMFVISIFLAHFLFYCLFYLANLMAFWSREAMGPLFLFEWTTEFASGAYFPLTILPMVWFSFLAALPFMYLMFIPMEIYLGRMPMSEVYSNITLQTMWIFFVSILLVFVWKKGLRRYSGEGI